MAEDKSTHGRGWHGDSRGHARAGAKGGQITARRKQGSGFYEEIGKKGGRASSGSFRKGSERAREAGRKGGRSSRR